MLKELTEALGPWPILQLLFGLAVLGGGIYAIFRGVNTKKEEPTIHLEDRRAEWEAYNQLRNIEENSFKLVELQKQSNELQRQMVDSFKQLAGILWNQPRL